MKSLNAKHLIRAVFRVENGNAGPNGVGMGFGHVEAWHKSNWESSPYCTVNEFISAEIGRFLRLPIPPFGLTCGVDGRYFFSSLNFNFGQKEQLPPILPDQTWECLPDTCTGILLFDILIANNDRHDENLVVDRVSKPTDISVFDHDQALFGGGGDLRGVNRLEQLKDHLGISGGKLSQGNRHCLLDVFDNSGFVEKWLERIESIPEWFIYDICKSCKEIGLTTSDVGTVADFLFYRSRNLQKIITINSEEFSLVKTWPWKGSLFQ